MTDMQATKPHLSRDHLLELLRAMVRIRRFEEKCAELYQQEKIRGFLHLYIGEEAIAVGAMQALAPADAVVTTYREHGHALARGWRWMRSWPRCMAKPKAAATGAAGRCICSTLPPASMAATLLSAADCRSPSAWRWRRRCSSATASPRVSLARVRSPRASSTNA